ncbi:MAG TPA: choice-of-anchor Q domain-containing protein [Pyrinomonadaceae bacterium]|nr:choice-of-anchor Q domain-containing protein [Pyrinomonadaceae bacterium]
MNPHLPGKRVCARAAITLLVSLFIVIIASHLPASHAAVTFHVTSLLDTPDATPGDGTCADVNGACTLRAAIQETNSFPGDDTINFVATGTINLTGALPVLSSNVTINGPGSGLLTVRRDIGGNYRIFQSSGTSSISGLTITNGRTPDAVTEDVAPFGGGIWQTGGSLTLRDVVVTGNRTGNGGPMRFNSPNLGGFGGFGGGIYATGTLTMTDCVISNNTTGKGGDGNQFGGSGGRGAGIYFGPGTLTMTNVVVTGNQTGTGGGPHSGISGDAGGMWLGNDAFPNQPTVVNLNKVTVTDNTTATAPANGDSGTGGGIVVIQGTVNMTDSSVRNNHTGDATTTSAGRGGGIFNSGTLTIRNSLISGNSTGDNSFGSNNNGGGIASFSSLTLVNTTVSGNSTGAQTAGIGGGVFVFNFATLINCTVTGNSTPGDHANGVGGFGSVITLANTIVAGNGDSPNDKDLENTLFSAPTFVSQGHNLIGNADGVTAFNGVGDQIGTTAAPLNPHLGPLADNGGLTLTHALLTNSTALDAGSNALAKDPNITIETDQRGAGRFADSLDPDSLAVVDIGAFEFHQTFEDITNKTTNEDTPITITFGLGDNGPGVTSVTATSNNQVVVPNPNLVLSGAGAARSLQITPAANQSGLAMITVTVNLSGGGSLMDTFTLTVNPVNDRPTFFVLGAPAILEDSGAQTVNLVTNINPGPLEEAQSVSFTTTVNTNPGLFSVAPAVNSSGTLTYTPAPNAFGDAIVTVVMKDNGGTANGGVDTSIEQAFTISVTPVNDAPTFTAGANQTVNEDAGFQFVSNWAANISQGPNESDALSFQVTNNTNSALFSQQPAVFTNGLLTYVPASNASGSASITIVLKDTGGTANGGVDTSAPQTFTITVAPVNDPPLINLQSTFVQTIQQTPLVFSGGNFNGIGLSDVDAGSDPIRVTLTATQGTLTLSSTAGLTFVSGDGVDDETMTFTGFIGTINSRLNGLTFTPNNGFAGIASLQIVANDEGHNGAGGAQSTTGNITINVLSGGRLSFNTGTYGVNESGSTATITVLRAGGTAGTTTVNYATSNGTATSGASCTSGVDYIPASGTFTWNNGDFSVRQFTITICNDGSNEDDETINLTLSNAGGTGSLGTQPTATLTIGNDDAPVLLTEELTDHAIALDLVTLTRDPFSLTNPFNFGDDQRRRVSLFVWRLGLLPSDTVASVAVVARDDEGRTYELPVEALNPVALVPDVSQVVVRLPDNVIGAPRDLRLKVTLRGPGSNEAFIKIAAH